ncbi:hypothetical protein F4810DRAFT_285367 [Camillea tinctor]|nr:hypothetical protein F4810DRAFT_285367 [Camillea tinctor]
MYVHNSIQSMWLMPPLRYKHCSVLLLVVSTPAILTFPSRLRSLQLELFFLLFFFPLFIPLFRFYLHTSNPSLSLITYFYLRLHLYLYLHLYLHLYLNKYTRIHLTTTTRDNNSQDNRTRISDLELLISFTCLPLPPFGGVGSLYSTFSNSISSVCSFLFFFYLSLCLSISLSLSSPQLPLHLRKESKKFSCMHAFPNALYFHYRTTHAAATSSGLQGTFLLNYLIEGAAASYTTTTSIGTLQFLPLHLLTAFRPSPFAFRDFPNPSTHYYT